MTETTLYEKLLGIERPWRVRDVRLALDQGDVEVGVEFAGETLVCPTCGDTPAATGTASSTRSGRDSLPLVVAPNRSKCS